MTTDIFWDLREWTRVTDQLDHLHDSGALDQHSGELARLLRYRFNWRIRERAVQSLSTLSKPDHRILRLVLDIASDEHTEFDLRTLAADSLCGLITKRQQQGTWTSDLKKDILESLSAAMNPHHPVEFQRAARRVIDCAQKNERAAISI